MWWGASLSLMIQASTQGARYRVGRSKTETKVSISNIDGLYRLVKLLFYTPFFLLFLCVLFARIQVVPLAEFYDAFNHSPRDHYYV